MTVSDKVAVAVRAAGCVESVTVRSALTVPAVPLGTRIQAVASLAKLDVDANPETARNYQVMSIPTMAVFSKGQLVKTIVGARPKGAILKELGEYVG